MDIIYWINILHKNVIYSKHILFSVTIISRPFLLIIILESTYNMVVHTNSKYKFINLNTPKYIS
jgi:hypothetical protein